MMSRPECGAPNGGVALDEEAGAATAGNPQLKLAEATALDVSATWHLGDAASLTVVPLNKDVEGFLESAAKERVGPEALDNSSSGTHCLSNVSPVSFDTATEQSEVSGSEVSCQNAWAHCIGVQAKYTHIDSDGVGNLPQTGLFEHDFNLVGFYEQKAFSFRLAYDWRNDFPPSPSFDGVPMYEERRGQIDAAVKHRISDGFAVHLDLINLADERVDHYATLKQTPLRIANMGVRAFLGLRVTSVADEARLGADGPGPYRLALPAPLSDLAYLPLPCWLQ